MSDITLRLVKGSPLTNQEVDDNFANLNTDKYESGDSASFQDLTLDGMSGPLTWNVDEGTLDVPLNAQVTLQAGQEFVFYAKATEAINNGDVVMFAGAQGGHLLIAKCDMGAAGFDPSHIVGIATQSFAINDFGYVTSSGKVRGIDTSGFTEGTILYVDPTTAGGYTSTKPTPPNHIVQVAAVTRSHATQGTVLTRVSHMPDTDEVPEGSTNLYFTDARAVSAIKADGDWNATNWDTAYSWGDHAGLYLPIDAVTLPDQTGHAGQFLTTNGTTADWATVDTSLGDTAYGWGDHSTQSYATQTYVNNAVSNLVDSAPATLDTLNELAAALGDDPNFAATVTNSIGTKWTQDNTKISNWDTAYSWGNHASAGYLTSLPSHNHDGRYVYSDYINSGYDWNTFSYGSNEGVITRVESSAANPPATGVYNWSLYQQGDSVRGSQIAVSAYAGGNRMYLRTSNGGSGWNGWDRMFADNYHPNADKWTTARSHTVTLTGDVTGSATQSVDGTGNRTWTVSTAVGNDSHSHSNYMLRGNASQSDPNNMFNSSGYRFDPHANNPTNEHYAILTYGNQGNVTGQLATHFVSGATYNRAHNSSWSAWSRMFDDEYHPNADKWTTARTISLSGDLNGSVSLDGSANVTLSAQVVNNSHSHSNYLNKYSELSSGDLNTFAANESGVYFGNDGYSGVSNIPYANYFTMLHLRNPYSDVNSASNSLDRAAQLWFGDTPGRAYWRPYQGSTTGWHGWEKLWTSVNDGSGSGLDADLLDGYHASSFLAKSGGTMTGDLLVQDDIKSTGQIRATGWWNTNTGTSGHDLATEIGVSAGVSHILSYNRASSSYGNLNISAANVDFPQGNVSIGGATAWHSGNDGSGSGLDADLLDGQQGSYYNQSQFTGDSFYSSSSTTKHSTLEASTYNNVGYIYGSNPSSYSDGSIYTAAYSSSWVSQIFADYRSGNFWTRTKNSGTWQAFNKIWTSGNDGSGSGLDADTLDGQQGSYYAAASSLGSYLPLSGGNISGGLVIDGSIDSGGTDYGYYQSAGTNLILKGDASGRSGIFFQSEKNGTNINHTSDYGFIQFHSYGYGSSSGEAIDMVIGTANDSTDHLILTTPYTSGLKFGYRNATSGTGLTITDIWHGANDGSGSGLDADLLDGLNSTDFYRSNNPSGYITASHLNDYTNGAYRVIADYSATNTWYINSRSRFTWARSHDWTLTYDLYIGSGTAGANSGWVELGQRQSNVANGTFRGTRFVRRTNGAMVDGDVRAANYYMAGDSNYFTNGSWGFRHQTPSGYIEFGPANTSHAHIYTDRPNFYFNKQLLVLNNTVWNAGNDGSGSGLDADLLDGYHASSMLPSAGADVVLTSGYATDYSNALNYWQSSGLDTNYAPSTDWHNTIRLAHGGGVSYYSNTLAIRMTGSQVGTIWTQTRMNGSLQGWNKHWHSNNDGSGSGLDADLLDGLDSGSFAQRGAGNTFTGLNYFRSNQNTSGSNAPLQAYSTGNTGAIMSFHRSGHYAVNMGLDSDNVFRIGGWSASTNRLQMDMSGNLTMAGNITAYSDIRLKENIKVIDSALEKVTLIRGVTFTRNDTDDPDKSHTGVIAQEVEAVLPEAVSEDNSGIKNVAYGNMVGLLIEAIKELKSEVDNLKQQLKDK